MRSILAIMLVIPMGACAASNSSESYSKRESITYPLRNDGTRDYTKPAIATDRDGTSYPLRNDGTRDYTKPATRTSR